MCIDKHKEHNKTVNGVHREKKNLKKIAHLYGEIFLYLRLLYWRPRVPNRRNAIASFGHTHLIHQHMHICINFIELALDTQRMHLTPGLSA